jgi:hypothetical protein
MVADLKNAAFENMVGNEFATGSSERKVENHESVAESTRRA